MQIPSLNQIVTKQKRYRYWFDQALPRITPELAPLFEHKLRQYRETLGELVANQTQPEGTQDSEALVAATRSLLCLERELENLENEARLTGRIPQRK